MGRPKLRFKPLPTERLYQSQQTVRRQKEHFEKKREYFSKTLDSLLKADHKQNEVAENWEKYFRNNIAICDRNIQLYATIYDTSNNVSSYDDGGPLDSLFQKFALFFDGTKNEPAKKLLKEHLFITDVHADNVLGRISSTMTGKSKDEAKLAKRV